MKILTQLLFVMLFTYSYGQGETVINFWKENGRIEHNYANTELKTPFKLVFNQADFINDSVRISENSESIGLGKFGSGNLQNSGNPGDATRHYFIKIQRVDNKVIFFPFDKKKDITDIDRSILSLKLQINNDSITTIRYTLKDGTEEKRVKVEAPSYQIGYVYYDAIALLSNDITAVDKLKIFNAYGYKENSDNPYLQPIYKKTLYQVGANNAPQGFLSSVGGMDVTNFAAGLARFLAERAKEELNDAFFKKMKEQLNAYPELKTVFPQTNQLLQTIENYSYSSILPVLKDRFEMDMRDLPENLYQIKDLDSSDCNSTQKCSCGNDTHCKKNLSCNKCKQCRCKQRLSKIHDFFQELEGQWLTVGLFTVKEAFQSGSPANLLSSIASSEDLQKVKDSSIKKSNLDSYNIASSIELTDFISQSLISKDENQVWISSSEFNALFKTKDAFQVYLGLLVALQDQNAEQILFYKENIESKILFRDILVQSHDAQVKIQTLIKNTYAAFNTANLAVKTILSANTTSDEPDPQAMYDYYKLVTGSLKQIITNPLMKELTKRDLGAEYLKIAQFLDPSVDMAYHISTKKYSSAIYDAVTILNHIPGFEDKVGKPFIKYGTLISTVASAQSSDEVKKAIEASVLPAGSSAIKRKSAWSISVNGYVGLYYGVAHSKSRDTLFNISTNTLDTITRNSAYNTYGLYAPIGLSFNRGFKCGWGFTFSTQILDLGALVNFYATKGDKAALPTDFKVRLSDILSPGLQLGVNIPGCPITVMGGFQYVPALNKISQVTSSEPFSPVAWRAQLGVVVDIPLYNLKVWDFRK